MRDDIMARRADMNVNEVLSNRAIQLLGGAVGSKTPVCRCESRKGRLKDAGLSM
jgi:hypothetical protein